MKKAASKSPLKEPLLRLPGQSIDEQMDRLFNEKLLNYGLFAFAFFLLVLISWIQALNQSQIDPWLMSIVAAPVIAYCAFGFWQTAKEIKRLRLGRDGERAVAEQLDALKQQSAIVFHDLIADGFNLDHVGVGSGLFC
jgi:cation transport ATPase